MKFSLMRTFNASADAELCVAIMFVHPACATEADFLFGLRPRSQGTKRKKGHPPVQIGEWAPPFYCGIPGKSLEVPENLRQPGKQPVESWSPQSEAALLACTGAKSSVPGCVTGTQRRG